MLRRSTSSVYAEPIAIPRAARAPRAKASSRFPFIRKMLSVFNRKPAAIHPTNSRSPVASRSPVMPPDAMPIPPTNIEIANRWIEEPLVNPYTQEVIEISIHNDSAYVKLYKKVIKGLIADLLTHYPPNHILTIEDCKYIKDNLPIIHSIIDIKDDKDDKNIQYIKYDHLFIRYFVNKIGIYKYDIRYREDSDIKLYLNIYKSIKTKNTTSLSQSPKASLKQLKKLPQTKEVKELLAVLASQSPVSPVSPNSPNSPKFAINNYKTNEDLLRNNIDFSKTDISIGKLIVNMCVDIRRILYMRETDITLENYKIALHNKKTLEYVNYIYNNLKFAEISGISVIMSRYYDRLSRDTIEDIKHIYNKIKTYIYNKLYTDIYNKREKEAKTKKIKEDGVLMEFIKIYEHILLLYARYFNQFIDPSVSIKAYDESSSAAVIRLNPYCPIDAQDTITFDNIRDFGVMKRKYVINIIAYNKDSKKVLYFCYDTVYLYNYILNSIAVSTEGKSDIEQAGEILSDKGSRYIPKNPSTNLPFTDDELDEICNKIKFLTEKPTYNSHADIKEAIKQKYIRNTTRLLRTVYLKEPNNLQYLQERVWNIKKKV